MPEPLPRLLAALRTAAPELDGTALAEALWLAAQRAAAEDAGAGPRPVRDPSTDAEDGDGDRSTGRAGRQRPVPPATDPDRTPGRPGGTTPPSRTAPDDARPDGTTARPLHERLPGSATAVHGQAVAAPHSGGLPRALELTRALRPWKRRWPEGRGSALDIDATVDGYARSGELIPVLTAAPERWFDLVLVVDRSPGMRVWTETVAEFTAVLDRLGAFRTLQVTDLTFDERGAPRAPGPLRAADGRRVVMVVSDCMAEAWRRPEVWHLLRDWAGAHPTALLNPLPTKLWRRGGLNLPTSRFTPAAPGSHRSRVPVEPPALALAPGSADDGEGAGAGGVEGEWLPVPVLSLTPHSLGRWSHTLMRADPDGCTAVLVPPTGRPTPLGPARPPATPLPPAERTRRFLRTASPRAARLAVLCSAFDRFSLRLLHLVRAQLVPDAALADVAEVVTSGVFDVVDEGGDLVELVLPPDAQAVLREHLPTHEVWALHQALDQHLANRGTGRTRLPSVARGDGEGARSLAAERAAFARASRRTLELLGLAEPEPGADPAADPGPVVDLPPAPEPYVGHGELLERLAHDVFTDGRRRIVWITAQEGVPGAGRTALALAVGHRVAADFPDGVHFVPLRASGRRPVDPLAALLGLLADMGGKTGEGSSETVRECADAVLDLLRGRRVLLLLDDVGDDHFVGMLAAELPEGCAILVTSRGLPTAGWSNQFVVELPPLAGEDANRLLAAGLQKVGGGKWWPLSLRILGAALRSPLAEPRTRHLLGEARDSGAVIGPETAVRHVLDHSVFGLVGVLVRLVEATTGEFTSAEASAVLDVAPDRVSEHLEGLVNERMLEPAWRGRHAFPTVVYEEIARRPGYDERRELSRARIAEFHRRAAAGFHRARHPDSLLPELLGIVPLAVPHPEVWVPNALASPAVDADTLLLLQDVGSTPLYRVRFAYAALRHISSSGTGTGNGPGAARAVLALASSLYRVGRHEEAWEALHHVSSTVLEADSATYGHSSLLRAQLAVAVRPDRARDAAVWARVAVARLNRTSSEYVDALLCLEALAAVTDEDDQLLLVQEKVIAHLRSWRRHAEEARALVRMAGTQLRLGRRAEVEAAAERALALLDGADGPDDAATREAALRLRREAGAPPREPIVIALRAAAPTRLLAPTVRALLADLSFLGPLGAQAHTLDDDLVLLVDGATPLARLLLALVERLPLRLDRAAVRLAVHKGPVLGDPEDDVGVEYTRTMLRSAEFGRVRANYPDDVVLCVSPEAYETLSGEEAAGDGSLAGTYSPREVRSSSGDVVCVILIPRVDLSAYDAQLMELARVFNELDPDGSTLAGLVRDALDTVLDPRTTGRFDPELLTDAERERVAGELARALDRGVFPFRAGGPGGLLWERPQGTVRLGVRVRAYAPPRIAEALPVLSEDGTPYLLVYAEDARARWSAGLVRGRYGRLNPGTTLWLHRDASFPENVLLSLPERIREAILRPSDDVGRVAELFGRVRLRTVPGTALRPLVADQERDRDRDRDRDRERSMERVVRLAGRALRDEGVLLLAGNPRGRAMAEALKLPLPPPGSYLSAPLTRRLPAHEGRPAVVVDGVSWVVAQDGDTLASLPPGFPGLRLR
ncbi:NaeI family type II restriction endonuclease [Streptomyces fradiae]|uniref:NaeI family type II restriction endonuclease n=1 Tax=Streptomyces fradiae TaxID=1906 RepID=UPI0035157A5A